MTINYRAVHTKSPWRKVGNHKTIEGAIDGKDGAKALLLKKGRVGKKWEQYGQPLCVFVWDSLKPKGYVLRINPLNIAEVQTVELHLDVILRHEAAEICSEVALSDYFQSAAVKPQSVLLPEERSAASTPVGVDLPPRTNTTTSSFLRDTNVKEWVQTNAGGICEGCGNPAPFVLEDGTPFLEVHHVRYLADGGSDKVTNTVALCPNCHRRAHLSRDRKIFSGVLYERVSRLVRE